MSKQMCKSKDGNVSVSGGCGSNCDNCALCHTTLKFARMWGVMETLGKLPPMYQKDSGSREYENENLVLDWAKEYVAGKGKGKNTDLDLVGFFESKLESIWNI